MVVSLCFSPLVFSFLSGWSDSPAGQGSNRSHCVTGTVDCSQSLGDYRQRCEQHQSQITTTKGPKDQQLLRNLKTKYSRGFFRIGKISTGEGKYNFSYDDKYSMHHSMIKDVLAYGAKPILCLDGTPEWLADPEYYTQPGVYCPGVPPKDFDKYGKVVFDILKHYKNEYPEIEYLEVWNEVDANWEGICSETWPESVYYNVYHRIVNAVNSINASLPQNVLKLKVGGPTTYYFNSSRIKNFINYCANNGLKLDFVSWHDYHHRDDPAYLENEVKLVKQWLKDKGLTAETMVSEWSWRASNSETLDKNEAAKFAAFAAVGNYYWLSGGLDKSCLFALHNYPNFNGSVLVTHEVSADDGLPMPRYNVYRMMSRLKNTRLLAESTALESNGKGVNALATKDNREVAILVWNYQSDNTTDYSVTVNVNQLPEVFAQNSFKSETYLVDATHSNYAHDPLHFDLEKIEEKAFTPRQTYTNSLEMEHNSVALIVLSANAATSPTPTPSYDLNHDGQVNIKDVFPLLSHWLTQDTQPDFNQDSKVNSLDFTLLIKKLAGE